MFALLAGCDADDLHAIRFAGLFEPSAVAPLEEAEVVVPRFVIVAIARVCAVEFLMLFRQVVVA